MVEIYKAFVEELLQNKTAQDVQAFLKSKGIECTPEQVKQLGEMVKEQLAEKELSVDDLDAVSGGGLFDVLKNLAHETWAWIES